MPYLTPVLLVPTGTFTASGAGVSVEIAPASQLRLLLVVDAASGTTPSLVVKVETSPNDVTWRELYSFDAADEPVAARRIVGGADAYVRVSWVITGTTPSFTFDVTGHAATVFATADDVAALSLPKDALSASDDPQWLEIALSAATDYVTSYLGDVKGPLVEWGDDLKDATATIAAYKVMRRKGYTPEGDDDTFRQDYLDTLKWLEKVAANRVTPAVVVDSSPDDYEGGPDLYSDEARGY